MFRTHSDTLLAAADEELIGKELREGIYRLNVSEKFYGEVLVEDGALIELLSMCSVANLVGKRSVEVAMGAGYISKENVIYIQGVPHAQFTTME